MISAAVEGLVDEVVVRRVIEYSGGIPGPVHGKRGKAHLRLKLRGYNNAASFSPWVVVFDLNHDAQCAPPLVAALLPEPAPNMCVRIAVREVESWLLADRRRFASFLGVAADQTPTYPEQLSDPKATVVQLASRSSRRDLREDMIPRPGSGRAVGVGYVGRIIEFVQTKWRPDVAAESAESLHRCLNRVSDLITLSS